MRYGMNVMPLDTIPSSGLNFIVSSNNAGDSRTIEVGTTVMKIVIELLLRYFFFFVVCKTTWRSCENLQAVSNGALELGI